MNSYFQCFGDLDPRSGTGKGVARLSKVVNGVETQLASYDNLFPNGLPSTQVNIMSMTADGDKLSCTVGDKTSPVTISATDGTLPQANGGRLLTVVATRNIAIDNVRIAKKQAGLTPNTEPTNPDTAQVVTYASVGAPRYRAVFEFVGGNSLGVKATGVINSPTAQELNGQIKVYLPGGESAALTSPLVLGADGKARAILQFNAPLNPNQPVAIKFVPAGATREFLFLTGGSDPKAVVIASTVVTPHGVFNDPAAQLEEIARGDNGTTATGLVVSGSFTVRVFEKAPGGEVIFQIDGEDPNAKGQVVEAEFLSNNLALPAKVEVTIADPAGKYRFFVTADRDYFNPLFLLGGPSISFQDSAGNPYFSNITDITETPAPTGSLKPFTDPSTGDQGVQWISSNAVGLGFHTGVIGDDHAFVGNVSPGGGLSQKDPSAIQYSNVSLEDPNFGSLQRGSGSAVAAPNAVTISAGETGLGLYYAVPKFFDPPVTLTSRSSLAVPMKPLEIVKLSGRTVCSSDCVPGVMLTNLSPTTLSAWLTSKNGMFGPDLRSLGFKASLTLLPDEIEILGVDAAPNFTKDKYVVEIPTGSTVTIPVKLVDKTVTTSLSGALDGVTKNIKNLAGATLVDRETIIKTGLEIDSQEGSNVTIRPADFPHPEKSGTFIPDSVAVSVATPGTEKTVVRSGDCEIRGSFTSGGLTWGEDGDILYIKNKGDVEQAIEIKNTRTGDTWSGSLFGGSPPPNGAILKVDCSILVKLEVKVLKGPVILALGDGLRFKNPSDGTEFTRLAKNTATVKLPDMLGASIEFETGKEVRGRIAAGSVGSSFGADASGRIADAVITPLTGSLETTCTSGPGAADDKCFYEIADEFVRASTGGVEKKLVSTGSESLSDPTTGATTLGPVTGAGPITFLTAKVVDALGNVLADFSDPTPTVHEGRGANKLIIAPSGRTEKLIFNGAACVRALSDPAQRVVKRFLTSGTTTVCAKHSPVTGSQLDIYEPESLPALSAYDVPFVYESADPIWYVTSAINLPTGCTADKTSESVQLSTTGALETKSLAFAVSCSATTASNSSLIKTASAQEQEGKEIKGLVGKEVDIKHEGKFVDKNGKKPEKPFSLSSKAHLKAPEKAPPANKPVTLSTGESLWSLVIRYLNDSLPVNIVKQVVRKVAEYNQIRVPEWGLTGGGKDARRLLLGSLIDLTPLEELKEYLRK